uniref:Kinesin motor domain-containing protein n=1 Tax=Alexandrium monilatum TaxID=311494 RepID=A0A7S4SDZ2_9DINO
MVELLERPPPAAFGPGQPIIAWSAPAADAGEYNVRVAVRCRPLLPKETSECCRECVGVCYEDSSVLIGKTCFAFDHVFGTEASQERVHEDTARPLLECLGSGLNATLLAYGQTSSGKTYTLGSCNSTAVPEEQQGIIPRFVNALFRDVVYPRLAEAEITLRVSFVELHNEDINDLLEPNFVDKSRSISIRDDPQQGVVVSGVKQLDVKRPSELLRCLEKGAVFRTTASTNMNEQSSRSHAIFTVTMEQRSRTSGETLIAKVRFADLAGSERAKKTGTVGERFREGVNINQGLLALGNVISALGDPKLNRSHVPYRDSKLTRLLQDSLGGNSRTMMIACVSPADVHFSETLNTLKYANRAKNIKNKVTVNLSVKTSDVAKLREQIQEMHLELSRARQLQTMGLGGEAGVEGLTVQDLLALHRSHDVQQQEIARLQGELKAAKQGQREAAEEALQYRAKYERCTAARAAAGEEPEGAAAEQGDPGEEALLRYMREAKELQEQNSILEQRLKRALACGGADAAEEELEEADEPGSEPPTGLDLVEGSFGDFNVSFVDTFGCPPGMDDSFLPKALAGNEEALAHVAEDQREEEQFRSAQSEMQTTVRELDDVIKEKEALMEQLTKQSKVFRSMQARYEIRLRELRTAVGTATEEKEKMLKEMQQLAATKQRSPQDESEVAKRKAHLQGRLHEVNRQLVDLQRRQGEAQRLLRLKEQQAAQIRRMQEEIDRLRGQKLVVLSRMKCEEQHHRLWRRRCDARLRELLRKGAELQRQNRQQGKLLGKKTKEAEKSARKVEELKREQQQILEASRRHSLVQRSSARARRLREINERLQRELEERERKVQQLEAILVRRAHLREEPEAEASGELHEVEDNIETLDAQIYFASECIAQSQTDILRLTAAPSRPDEGGERAEADGGEATQHAEAPQEDGKCVTGLSGAEVVAELSSLEDAKATCLACFRALDEAQGEGAELRTRVSGLEAELAQKSLQVDELHARQRLAEAQWAEQASELQRLHLNKEVYLLSQVDRNLTEEHGLALAVPPPEEAPEPASDSLVRLLQCRTEQIELLQQQTEQLQQSLAEAERARDEAELASAAARRDAEHTLRAATTGAEAKVPSSEGPQEVASATLQRPAPDCSQCEAEAPAQTSGGDGGPPQLEASAGLAELESTLASEDAGFQVLEGIAQRTSEMLCSLWRDLGVDESTQRQRLGALAEATVQLCSGELRANEGRLAHLRQEHEGIQQMALANNLALPPELCAGGAAVATPLHERHKALERAAAGHLESCVARLRRDLTALFGLPANAGELPPERLAALVSGGARCLPGRESSAAASLQPRDLDVLGLGGPGAGDWLQQPALETFYHLEERQAEATALLEELRAQLGRVDEELMRHYEALATPEQQRCSFFERRGEGLPALAASQQELQQLQHSSRMNIAQGRLQLVEQWMELGTPAPAQDRVLQALRESSSRGQLEELRVLNTEMQRLGEKIRHRQTILEHMKSLSGLEDQIQEFERKASNSARLRGNSVKLLHEEKQRLHFRRRKDKFIEDLIVDVARWETMHSERFMHNGAALRDTLQQDLDDLREMGGLTLATDLGAVRKCSSGGVRGSCDGGSTPTSGVVASPAVQAVPSTAAGAAGPPNSARRATAEPRRRVAFGM